MNENPVGVLSGKTNEAEDAAPSPSPPVTPSSGSEPHVRSDWSWWPQSRAGSVVQILLLISTFLASVKEGDSGLYSAVSAFFLLTALRYGWWRLSAGNTTRHKHGPWWSTPGSVALGCWLVLLIIWSAGGFGSGSKLKNEVASSIDSNKQQWFDQFHPLGSATSAKLHSLDVANGSDGKRLTARFTIYWEGPFTKDGFTKIRAVYDEESGRWTRAEVMDANGTTNTQAVDGLVGFLDGFLSAQ